MTNPIFIVDAFVGDPPDALAGNPAGVCLLTEARDPAWMQAVARELNHSETAFLVPRAGVNAEFDLRWFTPRVEVDLCGHATLASAHVLAFERQLSSPTLRFHTRSGVLSAGIDANTRSAGSGSRGPEPQSRFARPTPAALDRSTKRIELDFPVKEVAPDVAPEGLAAALGVAPTRFFRTGNDGLVELDAEASVRSLRPDMSLLRALTLRAVMVTAPASTSGFDFASRFFAPNVGVDEDPVTGSAHCALAPHWAGKLGKRSLRALQVSPRGGCLELELDASAGRVKLGGFARTTVSGALHL